MYVKNILPIWTYVNINIFEYIYKSKPINICEPINIYEPI